MLWKDVLVTFLWLRKYQTLTIYRRKVFGLTVSVGSVYGGLAPRQECHGERVWHRRAAHMLVTRKQAAQGGSREGDVAFQPHPQGATSYKSPHLLTAHLL